MIFFKIGARENRNLNNQCNEINVKIGKKNDKTKSPNFSFTFSLLFHLNTRKNTSKQNKSLKIKSQLQLKLISHYYKENVIKN